MSEMLSLLNRIETHPTLFNTDDLKDWLSNVNLSI